MASSILVLDVEEGEALPAQKILWLVDKSSVRKPEARADSARIESAAEASGGERLALIRAMESRYSRPLPAAKSLGPAFRMFMSDTVYPAVKRALDISLVSLLLMVIWPIYALVALLIWLDDPGPVFYSQTRIGKYGKTFPFPKFRSMVRDADKLKDKLLAKNEMTGGITFKMKRDPRIIPIGFVIRKYSLDELPQLWSILKGDLSLVGPRPPVPREVALYTAADRRRLEAVPGLTCIWQVSGRSEIPFPRQVELDVEYLESRSLSLDLRLLLATIPAVLTGKGAY
jgi:lipopolysaccharide/colanic/teichoic acid biosynthesis glycosyltransferase